MMILRVEISSLDTQDQLGSSKLCLQLPSTDHHSCGENMYWSHRDTMTACVTQKNAQRDMQLPSTTRRSVKVSVRLKKACCRAMIV